jgi:hypothetical protein
MIKFTGRFLGALALLPYVYEDIEADRRALPQAMSIVVLSSVASGAAYWSDFGFTGLLAGSMATFVGWLVWTWLIYHIGTRWLPEATTQADWGEVLRTTGFAAAPGVLRVAALFAPVRDAVFAITAVWMLLAFVLAVRQALDYKQTWRAFAVCLAGWAIYAGLLFIVPMACELQTSTPAM